MYRGQYKTNIYLQYCILLIYSVYNTICTECFYPKIKVHTFKINLTIIQQIVFD